MNFSRNCWFPHELVPNMIDKVSVKLPLSICYWLIFTMGLTGNIAALTAIVHYGTMRLLHGPYLLGLTVSSLLLTLAGLPATAVQLLARSWPYGKTACVFSSLLQSSSLFSISLLLCTIAIHRYMTILRNTRSVINGSGQSKLFVILILIGLFSFVLSLPYFFFVKLIDSYTEGNDTILFCAPICGEVWPNTDMRKWYNLLVICVQFVMPTVTFFLCYGGINTVVRRQSLGRLVNAIVSEQLRNSLQNRRKRINRMMFSLIFSFVFPWTFHNCLIVAEEFGFLNYLITEEWMITVTNICHLFAMTYCIWNPLIYALYHPDIRSNLKRRRSSYGRDCATVL